MVLVSVVKLLKLPSTPVALAISSAKSEDVESECKSTSLIALTKLFLASVVKLDKRPSTPLALASSAAIFCSKASLIGFNFLGVIYLKSSVPSFTSFCVAISETPFLDSVAS